MSSGNSLPTFRDNSSLPSSGVNKGGFLTLEDETDELSRNVGKELPQLPGRNLISRVVLQVVRMVMKIQSVKVKSTF